MPRILTFPITGVEVPPVAVVSRGADPLTDISSWSPVDITPALWPPAGAKASAFEVELSGVTDHTRDGQIVVAVSEDDILDDEIPGTWSSTNAGRVGGIGSTNDVTAWRFDKFGAWRTDYISRTNADPSGELIAYDASFDASEVDVRVRCRHSNWAATGTNHIITRFNSSTSTADPWRLFRTSTGLSWQSRDNGTELDTVTATIADLGLTNDQWVWIRVLTSTSAAPRMFTSTDGSSWSEATTTRVGSGTPGGALNSSTQGIRVGGGVNAGQGFAGDISHALVYDGSGTLLADLSLDAMDASSDTSWTDSLGHTVTRGTSGTAVGSTVGDTVRARFEFDDAANVADWRIIVDAASGSVSVDELVLELEHRGWFAGQPIGVT